MQTKHMRIKDLGEEVRKHFPIFESSDVAYLDSAASSQKPSAVIDAVGKLYKQNYANTHRGIYKWSAETTAEFETTRNKVSRFLNSKSTSEVIFTSGTTGAINLVAYSWGNEFLKPGDEIVITLLEHHSNFVPWQLLSKRTGAKLCFAYPHPDGSFDEGCLQNVISSNTKLIAFTGLSNAIGFRLPIEKMLAIAKSVGAVTLIDAAQLAVHEALDVQALDVDFLALSSHKLYGPSGVGVLYAKEKLLESMPPFLSGGDMIRSVSVEGTTFSDLPHKFEAGTQNIEGVIGFGAALDYLGSIGWNAICQHEKNLLRKLLSELSNIPDVKIVGPYSLSANSTTVLPIGLVSFVCDKVHPHDVAQILDSQNVAVRAGHHCAQPLLRFLEVTSTTRVSFGIYNTFQDVDRLIKAINKAIKFFA